MLIVLRQRSRSANKIFLSSALSAGGTHSPRRCCTRMDSKRDSSALDSKWSDSKNPAVKNNGKA